MLASTNGPAPVQGSNGSGPGGADIVNLVIGALIGALVMGLFSFVGLARTRRRRAQADADLIRGQIYSLADVAKIAGDEAIPPPKPIRPAYPDERLHNFTRGVVLGALAGGVYGLVTAKQSGAAARAQLRETLLDLTREARAAVTDFTGWAADDAPAAPEPTADSLTLRSDPPDPPRTS
jgi:gas vesicle protein